MEISNISVRDYLKSLGIDVAHVDQKIQLDTIEKLMMDFALKAIEKQKVIGCISESQRCAKIRGGAFRVWEDLNEAEQLTPLIKVTL